MAVESPKKQTQFKPNQTQSPKSPNEYKLNYNKGLQKKSWFRSPNKQTQFLQKPKMNVNLYIIEDYENETAFRPQKNKPNSNPILKGSNYGAKFRYSGLGPAPFRHVYDDAGVRSRRYADSYR